MKLSHSEMSAFQKCRRKWYIQYHLRLRKNQPEANALTQGTAVHELLEAFYKEGVDWKDRATEMFNEIEESGASDAFASDLTAQLELAYIMVEGYEEWIEEECEDAGLEILANELVVKLDGAYDMDVDMVGTIDMVARLDGEILLMDHKTAARFEPPSPEYVSQLTFYSLILKGLGWVPEEALLPAHLNLLRKVKRTAAAKPPFYERRRVVVTRPMEDEMIYRIGSVSDDIKVAEEALEAGLSHFEVAPPTPSYFGCRGCTVRDLCDMMSHGDRYEDAMKAHYEVAPPRYSN